MLPTAPSTLQIRRASDFTLQQLTDLYNRTRVDYIVPMPMNAARLGEYISAYDVHLQHSFVATLGEENLGVIMMGKRPQRTWITRLGVLPSTRKHGAGRALMERTLQEAEEIGIPFAMLEVIKNNEPAHQLFLKLGFQEIGELLILRRPPNTPPPQPLIADAEILETPDALSLLNRNRGAQPWTAQSETMRNLSGISGLRVSLANGSRGWLLYQRQKFTLTRFIYQTEAGDPAEVARAFLSHLHHQYPRLDTQIENIRAEDPHLPAFYEMGYIESFRRIEMWRGTPPNWQGIMPPSPTQPNRKTS